MPAKNSSLILLSFFLLGLFCLITLFEVKAQNQEKTTPRPDQNTNQDIVVLIVDVVAVEPNEGQVNCLLFNSKESYLKNPYQNVNVNIGDSDKTKCIFYEVAKGTYAVSVIYDKDGNGKLNTGLFSIPTEPVGMSNNPKSTFGPPGFDAAKFELDTHKVITVNLSKVR